MPDALGLPTSREIGQLSKMSVSTGIMLEISAERLSQRGGPHFASTDKHPAVRLATLKAAGEAAVPFTSGLLIGIGEMRAERIASSRRCAARLYGDRVA